MLRPPWASALLLAPLLACGAAATAADEPLVITELTAAQRALAADPRLLAAQQTVHQARALARAAGAFPGPTLTATPLYTDLRHLDVEAELHQTLFDPLRGPTVRAARAELLVAVAAAELLAWEVGWEARRALLQVVAAEDLCGALREDLTWLRGLREAAQRACEIGERPGVDLLRAELEVARGEQALAAQEALWRQAAAALCDRLGLAQEPPWRCQSSPPPAVVPPESALLAGLPQHPRLQLAACQVALARQQTGAPRAQQQPSVELSGFREDQEHGVRLALSLPLFGRAAAHELRAAQAAVAAAEATAGAEQRQAVTALRGARLALLAAQQQLSRHGESVLTRAERLLALAKLGYELGQTTLVEVLDARRLLATTRHEAATLQAGWRLAWLELAAASGASPVIADAPSPPPNLPAPLLGPLPPATAVAPLTPAGALP